MAPSSTAHFVGFVESHWGGNLASSRRCPLGLVCGGLARLFPNRPRDSDSACPKGGVKSDTAFTAHRFVRLGRPRFPMESQLHVLCLIRSGTGSRGPWPRHREGFPLR